MARAWRWVKCAAPWVLCAALAALAVYLLDVSLIAGLTP